MRHLVIWLRRNPASLAGLLVVVLFLATAALAPLLAPGSANEVNTAQRLLPPSAAHWLGTDDRGRDVLWRTLLGSRVTLYIVAMSVLITTPIGVIVGCAAGSAPRLAEALLMRLTDVFLAFPALILAMAFVATLGPGLDHAILAIALSSWPVLARLAYAETLRVRNADFMAAVRMQGASRARVILRHLVPLCVPVVVVRVTLSISNTVLTAASLGFLGLGTQPPTPEWGVMLSQGRDFMGQCWWMIAVPGGAIVLVSLGFNFVGDGLRDLLDPRRGSAGSQ